MHLVEKASTRFMLIDIQSKGWKTKVQWPDGPRYDAPTLLIEEEIRCQQTMAVTSLGCNEEIVTFLSFL